MAKIEAIIGKPVKLDHDGSFHYSNRELKATLAQALDIGLPFEVQTTAGGYDPKGVEAAVSQMLARQHAPAPMNEKCNVIVAGTSLMAIDTVDVRRDYCTDALQHDLDKGWRILAVCVQPDGRRPDYVIGRIGGAPS